VPVIAREEYVEAVRRHLLSWASWAGFDTQGSQAYAILTVCRGLRTCRTRDDVSKREAARWASEVLPEYAALIRDAAAWRERARCGPAVDGAATRAASRAFVVEVARLVGEDR
jgi:hypothetical protein